MTMVFRFTLAILTIACAFQAFEITLAAEEPAAPDVKATFKRRHDQSEEDLRQQLQQIPEVGFNQTSAANIHEFLRNSTRPSTRGGSPALPPPDLGYRFYEQLARKHKRPEALLLPWRTGVDCQIGKESAEWLQSCSVNLRTGLQIAGAVNGAAPANGANLRMHMRSASLPGQPPNPWSQPDCVPTLVQMLQAENASLREVLVETLANIDGKEASLALAQRAVFDLSPQVREQAVRALKPRPWSEFQKVLLEGLRWPWQPAADHAAEAIVALGMKELTPDLITMLKEPDPALPINKEVNGRKGIYVRELVRINHLNNCLLCHAPSVSSQDLVRGLIPSPGQALTPVYYAARTGQFVRADTTFLRQDFSVVQPVANPGPWPAHQRFDYVLRERRANAQELKQHQALQKEPNPDSTYPQRDAVLFVLREFTGQEDGTLPADWLTLIDK